MANNNMEFPTIDRQACFVDNDKGLSIYYVIQYYSFERKMEGYNPFSILN